MTKKIKITIISILVLFITIIILLIYNKQTKIMDSKKAPAIEFSYIKNSVLDSLLQNHISINEIYVYTVKNGTKVTLSYDVYNELFIKDSKLQFLITNIILSEFSNQSYNYGNYIYCAFDRNEYPVFIEQLQELAVKKSSNSEIKELANLFQEFAKSKIFLVFSYNKSAGWFNYEEYIKKKNNSSPM